MFNKHEEQKFTPKINELSKEKDNRAKYTKEGKPAGRWEALYDLNVKKKEDMENLRRTYQQQKEEEEKELYSFKPTLLSNDYVKRDKKTDIKVRGDLWHARKMESNLIFFTFQIQIRNPYAERKNRNAGNRAMLIPTYNRMLISNKLGFRWRRVWWH